MSLINLEYTDYEIEFFKILQSLKIRFFSQEYVTIIKNDKVKHYKVDFIIKWAFYPEMKCEGIIFEIQGEHHLKKGRMRKDEEKKEDLEKAGYHVYEIWYNELKDKEKLKEKVLNILRNEGIKIG
ncbi:MAG: DUF559 domain-containing protein [Candidatus Pacearchaeota archaeon]